MENKRITLVTVYIHTSDLLNIKKQVREDSG